VGYGGETIGSKRALTDLAPSMVTTHVCDVPVQFPLHPPNAKPALGVASRATDVPPT
jgi:hypothetical protein